MTDEEFKERLKAALKDPRVLMDLHAIIMAATKDMKKD